MKEGERRGEGDGWRKTRTEGGRERDSERRRETEGGRERLVTCWLGTGRPRQAAKLKDW
jgi:hypothetical protein